MASVADITKKARLPEQIVPIVMRGDLLAELQLLEEQRAEARTRPAANDDRLAGPATTPAAELEASIDDLKNEIRASVEHFRLRGLSDTALADLTAQHPPRDGDEGDRDFGYNYDTFSVALVRACLIDPTVDTDDDLPALRAVIPRAAWHDLVNGAYALINNNPASAPFLRAG